MKLDMKNSLNTVRRDRIHEISERKAPSLLRLASLVYSSVNDFVFGDNLVQSVTGIQQGDPLDPVLFALTVDDIARSVKSPVNIRYLDDATIGGPVSCVHIDLSHVIPAPSAIGLEECLSKLEIININSSNFNNDVSLIRYVLQDVSVTELVGLSFLGSQINPTGCRRKLDKAVEQLDLISTRLAKIDARPALFLLRICFSMPRLLFTVRCSPCYQHADKLAAFDNNLKMTASTMCNVLFDDKGWHQTTLRIRHGGIELRATSDVALPAFASSRYA